MPVLEPLHSQKKRAMQKKIGYILASFGGQNAGGNTSDLLRKGAFWGTKCGVFVTRSFEKGYVLASFGGQIAG
jgi:hypothetical protein